MNENCDSCNPNPNRRLGAAESKTPMMEVKSSKSHMCEMDCSCGMSAGPMYIFSLLIVLGIAISIAVQSKILKALQKPKDQ